MNKFEDIHRESLNQQNAVISSDPGTKEITERALATLVANREAIAHADIFLAESQLFREQSEERLAVITHRLRAAGLRI